MIQEVSLKESKYRRVLTSLKTGLAGLVNMAVQQAGWEMEEEEERKEKEEKEEKEEGKEEQEEKEDEVKEEKKEK